MRPVTVRDVQTLIANGAGSTLKLGQGWYSTLVYLGDASIIAESSSGVVVGGAAASPSPSPAGSNMPLPLLTFTGDPSEVFSMPYNPPSDAYRAVIRSGLLECGMSGAEADEYLNARCVAGGS